MVEQHAEIGTGMTNDDDESTLMVTADSGMEGTLGLLLKDKRCADGINYISGKTGETALLKACGDESAPHCVLDLEGNEGISDEIFRRVDMARGVEAFFRS